MEHMVSLGHHRTGAPPVSFGVTSAFKDEPVMCPECLLPAYIHVESATWACVDPGCRYA